MLLNVSSGIWLLTWSENYIATNNKNSTNKRFINKNFTNNSYKNITYNRFIDQQKNIFNMQL